MELVVWPPMYSMVSFDADSLSVLTYIRFGNVPMNVYHKAKPWQSKTGQLPYLVHGQNFVSGVENILNYLRKENYGIEYDLPDSSLVNLRALQHTVERYLTPAINCLLWVDAECFTKVTRHLYGKSIGFPYSLYYLPQLRSGKIQALQNCQLFYRREPLSEKQIIYECFTNAKKCITSLSYILSDRRFFLGDRPTGVDAVVFGRLMPLLRLPLPTNPLTEHLRQCDNLIRFCDWVHTTYYRDVGPGDGLLTLPRPLSNDSTASASVPHHFRDITMFVAAALVLTMVYAVRSGIVHLSLGLDDSPADHNSQDQSLGRGEQQEAGETIQVSPEQSDRED